jgi:sulfite reductase alpha subunit-like flavoprotein
VNSELEVDRFLRVFGLHQQRGQVIEIRSYDPSVEVTIPSKTTYKAAARYYLDIGAAVTRQLPTSLSALAVRKQTRSELIRLGLDKESFQPEIAYRRLNLGQALSLIAPGYAFEEILSKWRDAELLDLLSRRKMYIFLYPFDAWHPDPPQSYL